MRLIVLIIALIFIWITTPCANSENFRKDIVHRNIIVRAVFPSELKPHSQTLVRLAQESLIRAENRLQVNLEEDAELYFDTLPTDHNGLTTVVPRNRILVHTEAPALASSIGISSNYLLETLVHEWAHLLSLQKHRGLFGPLSWIFGHTARPNGAWPRWIHEGLAVWTEESVGGRPSSGSIHFDLRLYAEASQRLQRPVLKNSDLDGQWELESHSAFRSGQVPYTFGYLIWKELSSKHGPQVLRDFTNLSSASLGISFRQVFSELGISIQQTFQDLQVRWSAPSLNSQRGTLISRADEIRGLSAFAGRTAWIESGEASKVVFVDAASPQQTRRTLWPYDLLRPTKVFSLSHKRWLILVHAKDEWTQNGFLSEQSPQRLRLLYWDENLSSPSCVFQLGDRLREVHLNEDEILWTRSLESGAFEVLKAQWEPLHCRISNQKILREPSPAFHRISAPWGALSGPQYFQVNTPQESSSVVETIYRSDLARLEIVDAPKGAVFTQFQVKSSDQTEALIFERSLDQWGPVYLRRNGSGEYVARRLALRTGAWEALIHPYQDQILWIEKFWDHDELRSMEMSEVEDLPILSTRFRWSSVQTQSQEAMFETKEAESLKPQGPADSIWPHFWIPSVLASEGGWSLAGQTFYNDLSNRWSGSTLLGYGSFTQRPFGSSLLSFVPSQREAVPTFSTYFQYSPRDVSFFGYPDQRVQELWSAELTMSSRFSLEQRWTGLLGVSYVFHYTGQLGSFEESYTRLPTFRLVIRNPSGVRPADALGLLTNHPSFLYFEQRIRWLKSPEFRSELSLLGKTSARTRIQGQVEFAHSETDNFPESYFVWGGQAPLSSTYSDNYLNRGFAVQQFAARQLLRLNAEFLWRMWNPRMASSWNRFRIQSLDLRAVSESITWNSIFGTRYRLGHQYASSVGTELDILGSGLHYINYKLSLGVFRGFGDFGATRFTANFRMGLDL